MHIKQVEVRTVSELAFRSLLTGASDATLMQGLVDKYSALYVASQPFVSRAITHPFCHRCATPLPRKGTPDSKALATVHTGVLGLSGLVLAAPYSVPAWIPPALVRF